jgi:putative hemolysin
VQGSLSIPLINDHLGEEWIEEDPEHYGTLAGFIIFKLNRIPTAGDKLEYKGFLAEVVDMDGRRIDKILLQRK